MQRIHCAGEIATVIARKQSPRSGGFPTTDPKNLREAANLPSGKRDAAARARNRSGSSLRRLVMTLD